MFLIFIILLPIILGGLILVYSIRVLALLIGAIFGLIAGIYQVRREKRLGQGGTPPTPGVTTHTPPKQARYSNRR